MKTTGSNDPGEPKSRKCGDTRVIVAWGGVSLVRLCVPERVLPIRRVRGWVGAGSDDPGLTPGATLSRSYAAL